LLILGISIREKFEIPEENHQIPKMCRNFRKHFIIELRGQRTFACQKNRERKHSRL